MKHVTSLSILIFAPIIALTFIKLSFATDNVCDKTIFSQKPTKDGLLKIECYAGSPGKYFLDLREISQSEYLNRSGEIRPVSIVVPTVKSQIANEPSVTKTQENVLSQTTDSTGYLVPLEASAELVSGDETAIKVFKKERIKEMFIKNVYWDGDHIVLDGKGFTLTNRGPVITGTPFECLPISSPYTDTMTFSFSKPCNISTLQKKILYLSVGEYDPSLQLQTKSEYLKAYKEIGGGKFFPLKRVEVFNKYLVTDKANINSKTSSKNVREKSNLQAKEDLKNKISEFNLDVKNKCGNITQDKECIRVKKILEILNSKCMSLVDEEEISKCIWAAGMTL